MTVESATYINQLDATKPGATDPKSEGDDHLRLLKSTVKASFPNVTGAVSATHTELGYVAGVTSALQTQIDAKAPLSSPALTGTPTAPTAAAGTNTTQLATTAHVFAERSNTVTLTNKTFNLANNTFAATSAQLAAAITDETGTGGLVFANSPALTGTPTAPTAAFGTSTTQLATTEFVQTAALNTALPAQIGNAGKFVTTNGTTASWASPLPTQTGNAGKYLTTDGTSANWSDITQTVQVVSSNTGAASSKVYVLTASLVLTLPASPAAGAWVGFVNRSGTTTASIGRNGSNIMGLAEDMSLDNTNASGTLVYADATRGWVLWD